jgi:ketopantoate reductase
MKIAIIGTGAMGSVYAVQFADAGHEVIAVDPWQAHVEAINSQGLRLTGPDGERLIQGIRATTNAKESAGAELFILATKAAAVGEAARTIAPILGDALVLTLSAPCAVFDKTLGELMVDTDLWSIATGCTLEAYAAGLAEGIDFSIDDPIAYVTDFGAAMLDARPSLALDYRAGRLSEIGAINGMVPVVAARHGLPAPFNQSLCAVMRVRERGFGGA